ncbi:MAG: ATP-binding protein [Thermodesulfovibrionales bacterium]|nr:ATP-binding protein [Thermodesulfovibrionales bacterium]
MNRTKGIKYFWSRLLAFSSRSIFDFNIEHLKKMVIVGTPLLLIITLLIGWLSARKVRETVVKDFNQQQLLLAKHAATQIEDSLNHLKRELSLLSLSPSIQYKESAFMDKRMDIAFLSIKDKGGVEIRFIDIKTHMVDDLGYRSVSPSREDIYYLGWAKREENKGHILICDIFGRDYGDNYKRPMTRLVIPVWQVSVDESHPVAQNKFSGALMFLVDATELTGKVTKGIQSGKTGYAWVVDRKGIFLYHHEKDFIGKNAFEVRKGKMPSISFTRINEIQKEKMLKGKEGTSWYISGWHRGQEGKIKKLIAYAPIRLDDTNKAENIWSVAAVAPINEVEGTIRGIQIGQFLLEGVVVFGILSGGFLIFSILLKWSIVLKKEVEEKTKELRKSEDLYRSLVENAEDIIFTVDREGKFLSMNRYGYNFLNKGHEDIMGFNIAELFHDEEAGLQLKTIERVFETNVSRNLISKVRVNGSEHWLSTIFSGLQDENGNVISVLGIARDITERKKVEEQMYHTEKLASVGTMAAGVAHEINNPLAIILGFTEMLTEKVPQDSEFYEILKTVEKQGLNAKRIVENLLSFARFSEPKEEEVDINENIEAVLAVEGNTLTLNNIFVERDIAESLPMVKGDPGEVQQVFFNIISNAISAMKGGGILKIVTRAVDGGRSVEIRISDTGWGIKKEHRAKIFDPFFTTKKVGEGTGLGLTISYALVTKHGGSITFETKTKEESEKTGTTFIITLPAIKK